MILVRIGAWQSEVVTQGHPFVLSTVYFSPRPVGAWSSKRGDRHARPSQDFDNGETRCLVEDERSGPAPAVPDGPV